MDGPLSPELLSKMDAYWRAANYLSVGQIYLYENPLLRTPLLPAHVKPRLLSHWGTTPGLNFIYVHLNRIIKKYDLNTIYVTGPGHGGPGIVANTYLEGTYSEFYPAVSQTEEGMKRLFKQFSFPGGIPSHVAPETPGSIHEGGELGYSLLHAYGAVFDNPDLLACCVVGDGEAETGPLAASWHSNKFLNPVGDGVVLPILHLNGYKIAGPTVLARLSNEELDHLFTGYGHQPLFVEGEDPGAMHQLMAAALDKALAEIQTMQSAARKQASAERPRWPMIILRTPKGWTGPKVVDGLPAEGSFRSHQVPLNKVKSSPAHLAALEQWMKSYRPEELFDGTGRLIPPLRELAPEGHRRMGANPHANGGQFLKDLIMPDFRTYAVDVAKPGHTVAEATRVMGDMLRDVMKLNAKPRNFRVVGPDETASNRLGSLFEVTDRTWMARVLPSDDHLSPDGRVMEVLSEHMCQGWLEGYLLTGRHGFFSCYEAFIHIIDSMFNQHAKWLKVTREIPWRRPIASLNYLLTSHVWRQDHNGFSHHLPLRWTLARVWPTTRALGGISGRFMLTGCHPAMKPARPARIFKVGFTAPSPATTKARGVLWWRTIRCPPSWAASAITRVRLPAIAVNWITRSASMPWSAFWAMRRSGSDGTSRRPRWIPAGTCWWWGPARLVSRPPTI